MSTLNASIVYVQNDRCAYTSDYLEYVLKTVATIYSEVVIVGNANVRELVVCALSMPLTQPRSHTLYYNYCCIQQYLFHDRIKT